MVWMSFPDAASARLAVQTLIGKRLAACAQLLDGASSVYRWKGKMEHSSECLVVLKTTKELLSRLTREAEKLHPYEVPEILAVDATHGSMSYMTWVAEECRPLDD